MSLEHVLNVTRYGASVRERGRGPLINFDCEWNFQFCLRASGKVDSVTVTGLGSHTKCHFFLSDRGQGGECCDHLWRDQRGSKLSACLCCPRCQCDIVMSASLPLPSYSPGPRHQTPASLIPSLNPTLGSDPSCREKVPDRLVTIPQNSRCVSCHQLRRSHHFNTRRDSSPASENWINVRVKRDLVLGNRITVSFSARWSSSSGRCTNFGYFKYFKVAKITRKWTL